MKIAIISLNSESSKQIGKECEKYFKEVEMLDLRKVDIKEDSKGITVLYENKKFKEYDCIYCRGSSKYDLLLYTLIIRMLH